MYLLTSNSETFIFYLEIDGYLNFKVDGYLKIYPLELFCVWLLVLSDRRDVYLTLSFFNGLFI